MIIRCKNTHKHNKNLMMWMKKGRLTFHLQKTKCQGENPLIVAILLSGEEEETQLFL